MTSTEFFIEAPASGNVVSACEWGHDSTYSLLVEFANGVLREYRHRGSVVPADLVGVGCYEVASTIADIEHRADQARMRRTFAAHSWSGNGPSRSCVCDAFGPCSVHAGRR